MKKLKYVFWLIFFGFFALLVWQNLEFFSAKNSLHIDLGIYQRTTPMLANGVIIAGFVGIGVLVTLVFYFASKFGVYRANKTIKELRSSLEERTSTLAELKNELASLKSDTFSNKATLEEPESGPETAESEAVENEVGQSSQV